LRLARPPHPARDIELLLARHLGCELGRAVRSARPCFGGEGGERDRRFRVEVMLSMLSSERRLYTGAHVGKSYQAHQDA
jgi:hypothetical protein